MRSENGSFRDFGREAAIGSIVDGGHEQDGPGMEKTGRLKQRQIYFAECDGRIKIGISGDVATRLAQLRTGAGAPVNLIAAVNGDEEIEKALHRKLRAFHIDGEWFRDCAETRAAIQNSLNNFPEHRPDGRPARTANKMFGTVAKAIWPHKTREKLAEIGGVDPRTASRWLSGENEPSGRVIAAIIVEITK